MGIKRKEIFIISYIFDMLVNYIIIVIDKYLISGKHTIAVSIYTIIAMIIF